MSIRRMKTVERWGDNRVVRMVDSKTTNHVLLLLNLRSQLMRRVVMQHRDREIVVR